MPPILDSPTLFFAFLAIGPAAAWIVSIAGWMITDDVGLFEGLFGIGTVFGLFILAISTAEPFLSMAAVTALVIAAVLYPLVRVALYTRAHVRIDIELMWSAYRLLDAKRTNVGAKVQLAKMCYKRGLNGPAIALLKAAVESAPEMLKDERKVLRLWESEHGPKVAQYDVRCPKCGRPNAATSRYCRKCGTAHLIQLAGGTWLGSGVALRAFWIWVVSVAAFVLAPALAVTLPPVVAIMSVVGVLVVSGVMFFRVLRGYQT
ncbi:MAG: zinc ribbon domain-containing protein [Armatimonadetes bacterium]|nr:zinc ribbon domain-containing protein [Armatimonadota bacterium]